MGSVEHLSRLNCDPSVNAPRSPSPRHMHCRQLSTGFIVTLSLGGAACMTLSSEPAGRKLRSYMQAHHGAAPPGLRSSCPDLALSPAACDAAGRAYGTGHHRVSLPPRALQVCRWRFLGSWGVISTSPLER